MIQRTVCLIMLWGLVAASAPAQAEEKPVLAVMEIDDQAGRFGEPDLRNATDYLRASLVTTKKYFVVDRSRQENKRRAIVDRLKRETHDPCYDDTCKVELGRELAADTLLTCRLSAMGKTCVFSCELIPLDRAVSEGGGLEKFDCTMDGLSGAVDDLVASMTGVGGTDKPVEPAPTPPTGYRPVSGIQPDRPVSTVRPTYSLREEYLMAGLPASDYDDYIISSLTTDGWRMYKRKKISGWHMAWCWAVPGSCMYTVALNGGNFWHFLRGLVYTGTYFGGYSMAISDGASGDTSNTGVYAGLAAVGLLGNIIDGALSIGATNRKMQRELLKSHPRQDRGNGFPGFGFTF